jgi:glycerol-3-phosphate acyltransferase PlsY
MVIMNPTLWLIIAFCSGALPFSVWLGRLALRTDIRRYGDYNPGAANVTRAGGWAWGGLALLLDMLKGAIPVGLAWYWGGLSGWPLVGVALAPILGHAYSPFLGFRGGKAIAVTGGVWGGLTVGEGPLLLALLLLLWYLVLAVDGWAVILTLFSFLVYLLAAGKDATLLAVWAGSLLILAWKHRTDLAQFPVPRPWLRRWIR